MQTTTTMTTNTVGGALWNGPICGTCGKRYLGRHTCSTEDILRRVGELLAHLPGTEPGRVPGNPTIGPDLGADRMSHCPCRPENGGRGICGCIMGGPQVVC